MRELYYSTAGDGVVVGSDPATVLRGPGVPDDVDEAAIGEYLVGEFGSWSETVYGAVETADPDSVADLLGERLREAVEARLRSRGTPQVLLSGGLDSTTVTAGLDQSETFRFDPIVHRGLLENPDRLEALVTDGELAAGASWTRTRPGRSWTRTSTATRARA